MATSTIQHDFQRLEQLYATGFQDAFLDNAIRKIVERQIARDEEDLRRVKDELAKFERQYGLTSAEFWQDFQTGRTSDTADFIEWNAFCKMRQRITARLRILQGGGVDE